MRARFSAVAAAALASLCAAPAAADIITVEISGTFSAGHDGMPLDAGFPNPGLANGSFAGNFTYDDAAPPFLTGGGIDRFEVLSNFVELRTPADVLDYTITIGGTNQLRLITGVPGGERLIIFLGDSTTMFPDDLRLSFDVSGLGLVADGSPLSVAEFITAVSNGVFQPDPFSILDVEAVPTDLTLGVASATVRVATPEPASLSLLGLGLVAVLGASRRRRRRPA